MSERHIPGRIEVSPSAVATIANQAVLSSYGVVGMSSKNLVDGLAQVLRADSRRGVEVHIDQDEIVIDLYVVIEYGVRVATVARNIISGVKFSVEKAIGVPVSSVNVHVQGLHVSGEPQKNRRTGRSSEQTAQAGRSQTGVREGRTSSGGKGRER
jgi:uncharacterized alkaline shock family protein YloU